MSLAPGAVIALLILAIGPAQAADNNRPNVIIIVADDLGVGDLSLNGSPIRTPNIDDLANNGVTLSDFYASGNICTPSRAGLLTGRYPIRSGLAHGLDVESGDGLPATETTIAEFLSERDYQTALIGKWHLGHTEEHHPLRHGFGHFFGVLYSNDMHPFFLYENEDIIDRNVDQSMLTRRYTQWATRFISENKNEPFFLYFAHTFPHIPLYASADFEGRSAAGIYGDTVEELDWSVGEVVAAVERAGLAENTLVIFTSDNGAWFEGSNAQYRNMKGLTWDGGFRVPLIASWPGRITAGGKSRGLSMNIDIFPTIAALLEDSSTDSPAFDGKDVWSLFQGEQVSPHDALFLFNGEDIAAVRSQRWKYVARAYYKSRYIGFEGIREAMGFEYELLFDMRDGQPERYSVATREPDAVEEMRQHLTRGREIFEPLRTAPPEKVYP